MTVWYLAMAVMLCLFVFDYLENDAKHRPDEITVFVVILLTALSGLRGDMGADLEGYVYFFKINPPLDQILSGQAPFSPDKGLEPLYALAISTFKVFSGNFNLFLGLQSFVLLLIVVKALSRVKAPVNIGLILYFFLFYLSHFGQQRMAIVYVLCLLASTYVIMSEPIKFVLVIVIGSLIQYTAIFFLPAYGLRYLLLAPRRGRPAVPIGGAPRGGPIRGLPMRTLHAFTLDATTLIKFGLGFAIAAYATVRLDVFGALYEMLMAMTGGLAGTIYAYKFIAYYERINMDLNILNAWFGISANIAILVFLYLNRGLWQASRMAPLFAMFAFGVVIIVAVYNFPWLGDRLFRMYSIGALVALFGVLAAQRKGASVTLPFLLAICVYEYLDFIATETEFYRFTSF